MEENGFEITDDIWQDIEALPAGSLLFVCNPNNPVGNCIREDLLQKIAEKCRSAGVYLLVDECYLELLPDEAARSMRHFLPRNPYLLIVRAFTKTYAMPGVRLGYLMASDQALIEKIHLQQPEWSVSMFAQKAGLAALSLDGTTNAYLASARDLIREERAYVCQRLRDLGAEVYDGEAGFVLFSCSRELYEPLRESGILIRRCDSMRGLEHADGSPQGADGRPQDIDGRPHFYRIGLRGHGDNTRLMDRIQELLLR
jgi:threonine-phosphate decarboxylase